MTRIDEISQIAERCDCGFVCEPTPKSIAETTQKAKETSREVLFMKGFNGRRFAQAELDMNSISRKYLQFLNRILEKHASQSAR